MTDRKKYFEHEGEFKVSKELAEDLTALFSPGSPGPQIDRAILDMANKHFTRGKQRRLSLLRWAGVGAAAAAVIVAAVMLNFQGQKASPRSEAIAPVAKTDIDRNGRVDILDAYTLACHVEKADRIRPEWDFNSDGIVDSEDVDTVAYAAVRLDKEVL